VRGSEDDAEYAFEADVRIYSGKAGLIVNYQILEDWSERYIEFYVDPNAQECRLEAVTRDANGVETARILLAMRALKSAYGQTFRMKVSNVTIAGDPAIYAIYCYINDFLVCEIEELETPTWTEGMHGYTCLGADGDYSEFTPYDIATGTGAYSTITDVKEVLRMKDPLTTLNEIEIENCIAEADLWIDGILTPKDVTVPSPVPDEINKASKYYAAYLFKSRAVTSEKDIAVYGTYEKSAKTFLENYIRANAEIPFLVGETDQT
jgi:hypothetical protein